MLRLPNARFDNLDAVKSDGTKVPAVRVGAKGCTLAIATYYFPLGSSESPFIADISVLAAHLSWGATVAGVFSVEVANFPLLEGGGDKGNSDTTDFDQTVAAWIPVNPANSYGAFVGGAGSAYANSTLTAAGAALGGGVIVCPNVATRRARIKAVITAGGLVRCGAWAKL